MLYSIIISPIETVVDWVFLFTINKVESVGVIGAVFGVSLVINFLALPLYSVADSLQEKERNIAKSLEFRVKRIKKAFRRDEQFMMLSEYYRQNNYHPMYALRSSLSILIEIPFFIAAYHYLSHNELLRGASWWIFSDLGSPDEFFAVKIGSFSFGVHILPILMTLINFISGAIYAKDAPFREKAQLYCIAVIFLALLYNAPSGLVIYWILNNIFSLIKNIVMKTRHPMRFLHIVVCSVLLFLTAYICLKHGSLTKKIAMALFSAFMMLFPLLRAVLMKSLPSEKLDAVLTPRNLPLLVFSGLALALLCGFTLPASVISTSPVEFSFLGKTASPTSYVWSSFFVFFGFFVFWPLAVYKMFGDRVRRILPAVFFVLLVCMLANVYVFEFPYGNMSVNFTLDDERVLKNASLFFSLVPILLLFLAALIFLAFARIKKLWILTLAVFSVCLAQSGIGIMKISAIKKQFAVHSENRDKYGKESLSVNSEIEPVYHLSRNGKNVIVLFLDRAISAFFPRAVEQFPELGKQFSGFVYYPNTISFSTNTSLAAPAMMGGYEYTPQAMNARPDEFLRDKHNESMLVLPKLFSDAGFEVTVSDPPWSNYAHEGDLTPFEPYEHVKAHSTFGKYTSLYFAEIGLKGGESVDRADNVCRKEIRNFSVMQTLYPPLRSTFYRLCRDKNQRDDRTYYNIFSSLYFLREQTDFASERNAYLFIDNDAPHEPHALSDDYLRISGEKKSIEESHYDVNAASLFQAAKYFDYLRANDAYDNTRIIIVSDHGQGLELDRFNRLSNQLDAARYNPLLLFKDFGSTAPLSTDHTFMTNADVVYLAKEGLPVSDENPFTHKKFVPQKENGADLYPVANGEHHADHLLKKKQFTLESVRGYHVQENIFDERNWIPLTVWQRQGGEK